MSEKSGLCAIGKVRLVSVDPKTKTKSPVPPEARKIYESISVSKVIPSQNKYKIK
jgi:acyl-CoA thioesterase FadM